MKGKSISLCVDEVAFEGRFGFGNTDIKGENQDLWVSFIWRSRESLLIRTCKYKRPLLKDWSLHFLFLNSFKLLIPTQITYRSIKIIQWRNFHYIYRLIETKREGKIIQVKQTQNVLRDCQPAITAAELSICNPCIFTR